MTSVQFIDESGLRLGFPADSFRFQELLAYRALSGQSLKEMDFAWHHNSRLHFLEIRDYRRLEGTLNLDDLVPASKESLPRRFSQLIDKLTDSLIIMLSVWAGTQRGNLIASELPVAAQGLTSIRLVIALGLPAHLSIHMGVLREAINARLRGRVALADISRVSVLDYDRLCANAAALGLQCQLLPF